jgi:hypothetical protein
MKMFFKYKFNDIKLVWYNIYIFLFSIYYLKITKSVASQKQKGRKKYLVGTAS